MRRTERIKAASLLLSGQRANEGPPSALSQQFTPRRMRLGAARPLGVLGQGANAKQWRLFPHTSRSETRKDRGGLWERPGGGPASSERQCYSNGFSPSSVFTVSRCASQVRERRPLPPLAARFEPSQPALSRGNDQPIRSLLNSFFPLLLLLHSSLCQVRTDNSI